jgi:hypothetical protein
MFKIFLQILLRFDMGFDLFELIVYNYEKLASSFLGNKFFVQKPTLTLYSRWVWDWYITLGIP